MGRWQGFQVDVSLLVPETIALAQGTTTCNEYENEKITMLFKGLIMTS